MSAHPVTTGQSQERDPLLIHYGPIYDRPQGESLALCSPIGGFATMSNHWPSVNCERCKDKGFHL